MKSISHIGENTSLCPGSVSRLRVSALEGDRVGEAWIEVNPAALVKEEFQLLQERIWGQDVCAMEKGWPEMRRPRRPFWDGDITHLIFVDAPTLGALLEAIRLDANRTV